MYVDGLESNVAARPNASSDPRSPHRAGGGNAAERTAQPKSVAPVVPEEVEDEVGADAETGETGERGVIRLLEEGHFKGVADVRLRINFYDDLSTKAGAAATQTAMAGTGALIDNVAAKAQELVSGWGLGEESQKAASDLLTQFEAAAQAALGESTSDGKVDTTRLADTLRQAFELFSGQLAALVPPPPDAVDPATDGPTDPAATEPQPSEPPAETDTTASPTADPAPPSPVPNPDLDSLAQLFADELAKLLSSVGGASQLPPLASEPTGNGKAYDKFVAIYNELTGQSRAPEPPAAPGDEQVDLLV